MDEEEKKKKKEKMDDGVARFFNHFEGIFILFLDLWEAQPCLWDPE